MWWFFIFIAVVCAEVAPEGTSQILSDCLLKLENRYNYTMEGEMVVITPFESRDTYINGRDKGAFGCIEYFKGMLLATLGSTQYVLDGDLTSILIDDPASPLADQQLYYFNRVVELSERVQGSATSTASASASTTAIPINWFAFAAGKPFQF